MASEPVWEGNMGRNWARFREATDRQLSKFGEVILDLLDAKPGERILDLGCGGGSTTLAIAEAVGPTGRVTGIDISPDLVAHARGRVEAFLQVHRTWAISVGLLVNVTTSALFLAMLTVDRPRAALHFGYAPSVSYNALATSLSGARPRATRVPLPTPILLASLHCW